MEQERQRVLDVLDYWHKIEFFIPFGLDQRIGDLESWQTRRLSAKLLGEVNDLVWRTFSPPRQMKITGYNLYLGVFDRSSITRVCETHLGTQPSPNFNIFEEDERTDLEGETCFAKISLSEQFIPKLDAVSVSTVPWALGTLASKGLSALAIDHFEAGKQDLQFSIKNFLTEREDNTDSALSALEVLKLFEMLCEWAGFRPDSDQPVAILEALAYEPAEGSPPDVPTPVASVEKAQAPSGTDSASEVAAPSAEDDEEVEPEIDILNSFYIKDIERAIDSVRNGHLPETLRQYLIPLAGSERLDLSSPEGRKAIYDGLAPEKMNAGHWLADPKHAMSQRQQFAINALLTQIAESGVFSVNGPPGTGKTTLLRDLFAENIVRRARVLAGLPTAKDAFEGASIPVSFAGNSKKTSIRKLIGALTGFEMVVASSNNAAVENISIDLPKRKELGDDWKSFSYLQPVAHNLAITVNKGNVISPSDEDMPWGLISCALGNSRNRKKFCERVMFETLENDHPEQPANLWQWLRTQHPVSFKTAAAAFHQADEAVTQAIALRSRFVELATFFASTDAQSFLLEPQQACDLAAAAVQTAEKSITQAREQVSSEQQSLDDLREDERLIDRKRPGWLARLFNTTAAKAHTREKVDNAAEQQQARERIKSLNLSLNQALKTDLDACTRSLSLAQQAFDQQQAQWQALAEELAEIKSHIQMPSAPAHLDELESDHLQIHGLWHDEALTALRSRLFAAALSLQQAWLAETGKSGGGFGGNIFALTQLLQNQKPENDDHSLWIWQSLFMIVPVVSTTFASFANQFRGLGVGALGWLYIDEAGQAVPQAAAGAMWRAKRAVVVGDPLQVEPVFTLPAKLISALSRLSSCTADESYAPHRVSVQELADLANPLGTYTQKEDDTFRWVGSPLRVHRRCVEPMFSLSNTIAYAQSMVFGLPARHKNDAAPVHCESCWIDLGGKTVHKQVVPQQIKFMVELLEQLYQEEEKLPALYVISPFKAIKLALHKALRDAHTNGQFKGLPAAQLRSWLKARVGTVHTFQGREEDTVFMVLGVDEDSLGAAQWASSKPNLLNVAVTRAKRRFYMVGDQEIWGSLRYFNETMAAATHLPRDTPAAFLRRHSVARQAALVN